MNAVGGDEGLPSVGVTIWCPGHSRPVIPLLAEPTQVRPARHADGPVWDDLAGELLWVDTAGQVRWGRVDPDGGVSDLAMRPVGEPLGAVARTTTPGWLLAAGSGLRGLAPDGQVSFLVDLTEEAGTQMRSGACDRAGRFFAGTGGLHETPGAGSLYRVDLDGTVVEALTGLAVATGIAWSPDDDILYLADSAAGTVTAFDYDVDLGTLDRPRVLLEFDGEAGAPYGLAVDLAGHLWIALWGTREVRRYSPAGTLEAVVRVQATRLTGCAFAGPGLDVLVVSTASAEGLSVREQATQPDAGRLFTTRVPDVLGRPSFPYRGSLRELTRV